MAKRILIRKIGRRWVVYWEGGSVVAKRFWLGNAVSRAKKEVKKQQSGHVQGITIYDHHVPTDVWSFESDGFPPL